MALNVIVTRANTLIRMYASEVKGLNEEKQLEGDPSSVRNPGLPLQVLALDSTRTSENTNPFQLLNFAPAHSVALLCMCVCVV